ncbi:hypothetical protein ES703_114828 [subsurface metagenome]
MRWLTSDKRRDTSDELQPFSANLIGGVRQILFALPGRQGLNPFAPESVQIVAGLVGIVNMRADVQNRPTQLLRYVSGQQARKRPPRPLDFYRPVLGFCSLKPGDYLRNSPISAEIHLFFYKREVKTSLVPLVSSFIYNLSLGNLVHKGATLGFGF